MGDNLYAPPTATVADKAEFPEGYLTSGLASKQLRRAGWLAYIYALLTLPSIVFSLLAALPETSGQFDSISDRFSLLLLVIWILYFLVFKRLMETRFLYRGLNVYLYLLVAIYLILMGLEFVPSDQASELTTVDIVSLAGVIVLGIISIIIGVKLKNAHIDYPYINAIAWTFIVSGGMIASVVLILVAILVSMLNSILTGRLLFYSARELDDANSSE